MKFYQLLQEIRNNTITSIDLTGTNVRDVGGIALGEALKTNNTLNSDDLSEKNNIIGAVAAASCYAKHSKMESGDRPEFECKSTLLIG
jgi:hypothetical protein